MEYTGFYDYRVEVYHEESLLATFGYVSNLFYLTLWLNIRYPKWTMIRVYHRLSGIFIGEYYKDDIPAKPRI